MSVFDTFYVCLGHAALQKGGPSLEDVKRRRRALNSFNLLPSTIPSPLPTNISKIAVPLMSASLMKLTSSSIGTTADLLMAPLKRPSADAVDEAIHILLSSVEKESLGPIRFATSDLYHVFYGAVRRG